MQGAVGATVTVGMPEAVDQREFGKVPGESKIAYNAESQLPLARSPRW